MKILKTFSIRFPMNYMNLSIKNKILIFYVCILSIICLILGSYSYVVASKSLKDEVTSINIKDINQTSDNINFLQKDITDLSTFICLNPLIQSLVTSNEASSEYENFTKYGLEPLNILLASKDYISFIFIYGDQGSKYYLSKDGSSGLNSYEEIKKSDIYKSAHALKGAPLWVNLDTKNNVFITDNRNPKIAMVRTIIDTNTLQESGLMVICINTSFIENIYAQDLKGSDSIVLLDNKNNIISSKDSKKIINSQDIPKLSPLLNESSGYHNTTLGGSEVLFTYSTIKESGWKLVSLTSQSEMFKSVQSIMTMTLAVIGLCIIISFFISIFVSSKLVNPIQKLLQSMKRVKSGNFKEKVDYEYNDEIGNLVCEYNDMIDNLQNLIDKVYKLQLKEKEAELKALQAQINPHFLYNTLDMIFWKSERAKQPEISEMIYALSKIFRTSLSNGNDFILVKSEKEFIENYLLLQGKRYRDKLDYSVDIDNDILDYYIPKLILQPFVENSIIHGTEADNDKSYLNISGKLVDGMLIFTIEDNGTGIDEITLEALLKNYNSNNTSNYKKGYAISNVKQRLELYYGDNHSLYIQSKLGQGTKITISIPFKGV
ncbi:cache domain-containing sensor histidine kinase [Clostridium manihotivorum]|uniref:histidine kinase n=1 Tax=Clostridium manihotivorum TaxID=2320868 RepID=A0A410DPJ0_9CLOT|nr:sensor histidine kinase [Clostridium manihotivorum]QAA30992.1 sensor histidine kinase [Clostridium manihotivorum]